MRLGSKMRVFRATDYSMYIWLDRWPLVMPLLLQIGETMAGIDTHLALTQFDDEPLKWSPPDLNKLISELVQTFLEVRGPDSDVNAFSAVFDTQADIDLVAVIRLAPDKTVRMSVADIRFNTKHTEDERAPLAYEQLLPLFCQLVAVAQPERAEVTKHPPITDPWFENTRVSIDLTKVPITIQWLNYFSKEWVERLGGRTTILNAPEGEVIEMPSGLVFVMQQEPFTYSNPEHVARQKKLHEYFKLSELHEQYPRPR